MTTKPEWNDGELAMVKELCVRLGAPAGQDERMAAQLLKRAVQVAEERSVSKVEALQYLLNLVVAGRDGRDPSDVLPPGRLGNG